MFSANQSNEQRLAYVINYADHAALWTHVEDLATAFKEHYQTTVIVIKPRGVTFNYSQSLPFKVVVIEAPSRFKTWQAIGQILTAQQPTLVHSVGFERDVLAAWALGKRRPWRWINTVVPSNNLPRSLWQRFLSVGLRDANSWSVFFAELQREYDKSPLARRSSTVIVPVPSRIFTRDEETSFSDSAEVLVLAHAHGNSGLDSALRTLALVRVACPHFLAKLVVLAEARPKFTALIEEFKLEDRVTFADDTGFDEAVKTCRVVLKLSADSSFDQRLVVALKMGKPLIIAQGEFFLALLKNQDGIRVVFPGDAYQASLALKEILTQSDLCAALAQRAKKSGTATFSFDDMIEKHRVLYRMLS